ncbi:MAG: hypothetical protein IIT55_07420, partial [Bacteroidaceae bacterium]|nr:hypothetical protein [Bacteroidaceae bacterium]
LKLLLKHQQNKTKRKKRFLLSPFCETFYTYIYKKLPTLTALAVFFSLVPHRLPRGGEKKVKSEK